MRPAPRDARQLIGAARAQLLKTIREPAMTRC
jgi:hypothetical protein